MTRPAITTEPTFRSRPQIDPEKVFFVITKLREFQVKEENIPSPYSEAEDASNPTDDGMREVLEETPDDPVIQELEAYLRALNVDELATMVALVYIGRGDFDPGDWEEAFAEAKQRDFRAARRVLIYSPLSADHLENTMDVFGETFDEYEKKHF
jgi:hypothetical protein